MEKKILAFVEEGKKSKNYSRYICENFGLAFKDVDDVELLDASLRVVRSRALQERKMAFHLFLKELKIYETISNATKTLLQQVLSEVGSDLNPKTFESLVRCLPSERALFDSHIFTWIKSSDDVSQIICAIDIFRKDLELRYETNKELCLDIFKRACLFLRYKKLVLKRGALGKKKKLRAHMKVRGVKVKKGMKVDVSIVELQKDDDVLVKYKPQGHDRMLKFVIEFVKDCDAVKILGRQLVLFLQKEDKLKSAAEVWTHFREELGEHEKEFSKTVEYLYMKPMYWAIREKELGVLDGMFRRVPSMKTPLRLAWKQEFKNEEDLDTALNRFETKLQSLPNPREFYCLPKHVRIECVSDEMKLLEAEKDILKSDILGVDAEWTNFMPSFNPDPKVSLLQLVTRHVAYLLFVPEFTNQTLKTVLRRIFTSSTVTTICFAGQGDVKRLKAQLGSTKSDTFKWLKFDLDLEQVARRVLPKQRWSLSKLVDKFIGKPLDKSIRMTDWNRRPLSPGQKAYAAADGYTLIVLHDILKWREEQRGETGNARIAFFAMMALFVWRGILQGRR